MKYLEGTLKVSAKGIGYVSPDLPTGGGNRNKAESIEIDPNFLKTGLSGDRVKVLLQPETSGEIRTGEIVEILERKRLEFVGTLEQEDGFYFLIPDDKRVYKDILIPAANLQTAKNGDKVLARIVEWTDPKKNPLGEVILVIGQPGENETEMQAIVYEKGFRPTFPPEVEKEAQKIKAEADENLRSEISQRKDFRHVLTFTIDPADAKDFDDALSFRRLDNGQTEVGIHIADVSHYLRPGSALDREAVKRATSIYLVDRTVPMLPEILSNDLCSLNEGEEKLAYAAVFTFNQEREIIAKWFGRTMIKSAKRFTYEAVQKILTEKTGPFFAELNELNKIAAKLRAKKFAQGAINFETTEIKFELAPNGKPLRVIKKERTDAHFLVEDLMLLANRQVAEFVSQKVGRRDHHFVYRVHDLPDIEKLKQLAEFISPLGYHLDLTKNGASSQSINNLLKAVAGKPEEAVVQTAAMRSMAKAVYSLINIGHYGLAFTDYTHFTSPIRRYPDIMVHRLLTYFLQDKKPPSAMLKEYARLVIHASQMELNAQEAERDSIRYKQIEFMLDKVGRVFDGVISGLAKWGIYVQEKETLAEGLVRLMELSDDYYIFDEKHYAMLGKNTGRKFRLGDKVRLKLLRADLRERVLDFVFV